MSDDKWLYLDKVRNPHLVLADAANSHRVIQYHDGPNGWVDTWDGMLYDRVTDMLYGMDSWNRVRVERRPQSDGLGRCPVCGAEFGNEWVKSEWPMCSDCGFMCDSVNQWNKLRYVD